MWIPHGRGIFLTFRPLLSTSLSSHVLPGGFFFASSGLAWPSLCLFARTGGSFCFQTLFRRHAFPPAMQSYWIRLERQVRISQPAPSVSAGTLFPKSWLQAAEIPNSLLYVHSKAR
ncbi:hypothetical protein CPAR01_14059 [Colletotrichum paranaense]|uniref:Secreted protein n=1 Tax=Colletotrichum paranaense TaxID=1914294 RepID=A0ABQ9S317_9PEZI|nr:uncharacterized protein CPAR01_14059 [Colletotrichum paranaense]KAK1523206.1 hypothetical protein CPAR01_14059 [Colletotrichum paranaense]